MGITNPTRDWDIAAVWNRRTNIGIHVDPIMNPDYGHSSTIQIFRDRKMGKTTNQMDPGKQTMANIETTTGIRPTYRSQPIRNESGQKKKKTGRTKKGRNSTYMYRRIY